MKPTRNKQPTLKSSRIHNNLSDHCNTNVRFVAVAETTSRMDATREEKDAPAVVDTVATATEDAKVADAKAADRVEAAGKGDGGEVKVVDSKLAESKTGDVDNAAGIELILLCFFDRRVCLLLWLAMDGWAMMAW